MEVNRHACATLKFNRPGWDVFQEDIERFDGTPYRGVDVLAAGLPCPPFSVAGKQLGKNDERNLFPAALRLAGEIKPRAVMIENVRGILDPVFEEYRGVVAAEFAKLGYASRWRLMNASDFGVPQLRPRAVCIALKSGSMDAFDWPAPMETSAPTVGEVLSDLMSSQGWAGAAAWSAGANEIAPTIVGGSHKHGGPDLGPTRARKAWAKLGVDGLGIANEAPSANFGGVPRLTVRMVARLQGFPDDWLFTGGKTQSYRQVGNAFPPPFAHAVAARLRSWLTQNSSVRKVG